MSRALGGWPGGESGGVELCVGGGLSVMVRILLVAGSGVLGAAHLPVSLLSDITHSGACSSCAPE